MYGSKSLQKRDFRSKAIEELFLVPQKTFQWKVVFSFMWKLF